MKWLNPEFIMLAVAVIALVAQATVAITVLIKLMWKIATKDEIKALKDEIRSLKADTERDIQSLKADTEKDIESLKTDTERDRDSIKEDLKEVRQNHTNHLENHPSPSSSKDESPSASQGPPDYSKIQATLKGETSTDERDQRTGS